MARGRRQDEARIERLRYVGTQLKIARANLGLTIPQAAASAGISPRTLSGAESGTSEISDTKRPGVEQALMLRAGSLTLAYRDGTPLVTAEPAPVALGEPVAAILAAPIDDADKVVLIDFYREQLGELATELTARIARSRRRPGRRAASGA